MEVFLMEIPAFQTEQKLNDVGRYVDVQRTVPELIAPQHIVRVSPTQSGIVIWFGQGIPILKSPLKYPDFVEQLKTLQGREEDVEDSTQGP